MGTALITGGAGGIGVALATLFAADGHALLLVDVSGKKLLEARQKVLENFSGCKVYLYECDLAVSGAAEMVSGFVQDNQLQIDYLVNNAGFGSYGFFHQTSWKRDERMLYLHNMFLTQLTKLLLPAMIARKFGRVLNVASLAGFQPGPLMAVYYATKAYIISFSQAIGNELKGTGVLVSVLCPGVTLTGFQAAVGNGQSQVKKKSLLATDAAYVAQCAYKGMHKGRAVIIPGRINNLMMFMNRFVPRSVTVGIVRRAQEKIRKHAVHADSNTLL